MDQVVGPYIFVQEASESYCNILNVSFRDYNYGCEGSMKAVYSFQTVNKNGLTYVSAIHYVKGKKYSSDRYYTIKFEG